MVNRTIKYITRLCKYPIAILLGLVIVFSVTSISQSISLDEQGRVLTKVSQIDTIPFPLHFPFGNDPLPREEEDQRESTDEKKWDDSYGLELYQSFGKSENKLHWFFLNQLEVKYSNRSQVLLFVLHHSWRSFLS